MDGFVKANQGWQQPADGADADPALYDGARAMWWYDQTDLPLYYQLANTFAVADHYHCSLPGPDVPEPDVPHRGDELRARRQHVPGPDELPLPDERRVASSTSSRSGTSTWTLYSRRAAGRGRRLRRRRAPRAGGAPSSRRLLAVPGGRAGRERCPQVSFVDPDLSSETHGGRGHATSTRRATSRAGSSS